MTTSTARRRDQCGGIGWRIGGRAVVWAAAGLIGAAAAWPALAGAIAGGGRYQSTLGIGQFGNNSSTVLNWDRTGDDFFGFAFDTGRREIGGVVGGRYTGRYGAEATYDFSGRAGLEMGLSVDSGTIAVDLPFDFGVDYGSADPSAWTDVDTSFAATSAASLQTTSPSVSAFADFVFDFNPYVWARGCAVGCFARTILDQDNRVTRSYELLAVNRDGDGQVRIGNVLGGGAYSLGDPIDIGDFGTLTVDNPNLTVSDGTPDAQSVLSGSAIAPVASLNFDIDSIIGTFASSAFGVPYTGGGELGIDVGPFEANVLVIDYDITPYLGLEQQVEVTPNAVMQMNFSRPMEVRINGASLGAVNRVAFTPGVDDVEFKFPGREVEVAGRVVLLPEVTNQLDLVGGVDHRLRAIGASIGIEDVGGIGFGPVYDTSNPLIPATTLVDLYDATYRLRGDMTEQASFAFTFGEGINLPGNRDNPIPNTASFAERLLGVQRFTATLGDTGDLAYSASGDFHHLFFDGNRYQGGTPCTSVLPNAPQGGRVQTGNSLSVNNNKAGHPASGCLTSGPTDHGVGPGLSGLTGSASTDTPMFFEVDLRDSGLAPPGSSPQFATDLTFSIEEFLDTGNGNDMEYHSFEQLVIDNVVGDGLYDLWALNPVSGSWDLVQANLGVGEVFNFTDYAAREYGLDIYPPSGIQRSQIWRGLYGVTEFRIAGIDYEFGDFLFGDPSLVVGMTFTDRTQLDPDNEYPITLGPENTDFLVTMGGTVESLDDPLGSIADLGPDSIDGLELPGVFETAVVRCFEGDCDGDAGTGLDSPADTPDDTLPLPPVPEGSDPGLPFQPTLVSGNDIVFDGLTLGTDVPLFDLLFRGANMLTGSSTPCSSGLPGYGDGQIAAVGVAGGDRFQALALDGLDAALVGPCFDMVERIGTPEFLGLGDAWAFFEIPILGNFLELMFDDAVVEALLVPTTGGGNTAFDGQFLARYGSHGGLATTTGGSAPATTNFGGSYLSGWNPLGYDVPLLFGSPSDYIALSLLSGPYDGSETMVIGLRFADTGVTGFSARSTTVPEPGAFALLAAGLAGLGLMRRRWTRRGG